MSAAFLSSASSTIRRATSSGGRSDAGTASRLGSPSARGPAAGGGAMVGSGDSVTWDGSSGSVSRYRSWSSMYAATAAGTRSSIGSFALTRRRISVAETSTCGPSRISTRPRRPGMLVVTASTSGGSWPGRVATATRARAAMPSGSRHVGRSAKASLDMMRVGSMGAPSAAARRASSVRVPSQGDPRPG
jgi:hypothetical protein